MFVCLYRNTFLTQKRSERPTDRRKMAQSLPLSLEKTRRRATTKTGRATPLHNTHAVAARPSTRPAGAAVHALFKRIARAHVIPKGEQYPQQAASHSKSNTRREGIAQARTTNQGPGPARPRRPLHAIERPAKESRATKARSRGHVPTATRWVRPQKHERRAR